MKVFVIDTKKIPLAPCSERRARKLLDGGKAAVFRRYPFTIIMKKEVENPVAPNLQLKIDPGSKVTGIAIVNQSSGSIEWAANLEHRGNKIKESLDDRRMMRRGRRNRKTRYRQARFDNRRREQGWIAPSLKSRIENTLTWVKRLMKVVSVSGISQELVRFDTQKMENPEISGIEYQQGELAGYEIKEYLLEKFGRKCVYCKKRDMALEIEHIIPRSRGGTNRVSNLTIACHKCNQKKGNRTAEEFGHPNVQKQAKEPLRDAAAVNSTRWSLYERLKEVSISIKIEVGTGGRTKFNRRKQNLPKTHWLDAACVGESTPEIKFTFNKVLCIEAVGKGTRKMMAKWDKTGRPSAYRPKDPYLFGVRNGDMVLVDTISPATNNKGKEVRFKGKDKNKFKGVYRVGGKDTQNEKLYVNKVLVKTLYIKRIVHKADSYDYKFISATEDLGQGFGRE